MISHESNKSSNRFAHGTQWVRADFHLHTNSDREFKLDSDGSKYYKDYIKALNVSNISLGVITNHNKFAFMEFKSLKREAMKESIFLLPGVELSIGDGSNGIHTIIVFSDKWIENNNDLINQFISTNFKNKTSDQYENENGRSDFGIIETIRLLESYHRDFFIIFPHVEEKCGLWNELDGGRLIELGENEFFRKHTLAFQKVRTINKAGKKNRAQLQQWLKEAYPAEVEGSDCKSIDTIGRGGECHIKIGDFSFEAVKYALIDYKNRVSTTPPSHDTSHITSVHFKGGSLEGNDIFLSPELNTLIGIRGSGKSSILEAIKYCLNIPHGDKAADREYKDELVAHSLGSGGKITIKAIDRRGQKYEVHRILDHEADIFVDNKLVPGVSTRETVLHNPIYFGQKDLSSSGDGFEKDLVEKLVGDKLKKIRTKINIQSQKVIDIILRLKKLSNVEEKRKEYISKEQQAQFMLKFYKDHGIEEKLEKQIFFDADSRKCKASVSIVENFINDIEEIINSHEDEIKNAAKYKTKINEDFFAKYWNEYNTIIALFDNIKVDTDKIKTKLTNLRVLGKDFDETKDSLKEEFAAIERKLSEKLEQEGAKGIRPDEFRKLKSSLDQTSQMLKALAKQEKEQANLRSELRQELSQLNLLWHEEFLAIQNELNKINQNNSSLQIEAEFKGDKSKYLAFIKDTFKGSRIRETTLAALIDEHPDFGSMFNNQSKVNESLGQSYLVFKQYFREKTDLLLPWQVPNKFTIKYRGKELKHHSLGQRASALILFVFSQKDHDVVIIDQPEDDLDNQTIYDDVIKFIRQLKPRTQFIFATHNANFPVLGDAEQVIACSYSMGKVNVISGSIDTPSIQKKIVDIMEGGEEAFAQRKRKYEIWKPLN